MSNLSDDKANLSYLLNYLISYLTHMQSCIFHKVLANSWPSPWRFYRILADCKLIDDQFLTGIFSFFFIWTLKSILTLMKNFIFEGSNYLCLCFFKNHRNLGLLNGTWSYKLNRFWNFTLPIEVFHWCTEFLTIRNVKSEIDRIRFNESYYSTFQ